MSIKFETVTEGKTKFYVSKGKISKKLPVFFNPAKESDRDLSVLLLRATGKKTVLDLLAASGARGLRLAKEAGAKVWFNDINSSAVKLIKKNAKLNKIKPLGISNKRADELLTGMREKFDFIDIDPFGSPITYVYQAIPRLEKDGILAVTATDTAALFGVFPWTCFRKYGSFSLKTPFSHELALRILAKAVIEIAAKQNISLKPIFAHATLHYYRIYFQASRSFVEKVLKDIGFICYCSKCKKRFVAKFGEWQKCKCGNKLSFAGPLYLGNLWDAELVNKMNLAQEKLKWGTRYTRFLKLLGEESKINVPFYYESFEFKKEKRIEEMINELKGKGFKASRTHFSGKGIRTNFFCD